MMEFNWGCYENMVIYNAITVLNEGNAHRSMERLFCLQGNLSHKHAVMCQNRAATNGGSIGPIPAQFWQITESLQGKSE